MRRHALHRLSPWPAAALLFASACGPAAPPAAPPPAEPPAQAASAAPAPPPQPLGTVTSGGMPADAPLYVEIAGVPAAVKAARGALGEAAVAQLGATIAHELGVGDATGRRFVEAVASVHVGAARATSSANAAIGVVFSDAQPMHEVLEAGTLADVGAFGAHGHKLKEKHGKDFLLWYEEAKLLVLGDEPMVNEVAAVVEGRKPGRPAAPPAPGAAADAPRAFASVAPALLDQLSEGHVSFLEPLRVAYETWAGGIRGSYRTAVTLPGVSLGSSAALPRRSFAIARRLPAETASYLAVSTAVPGGAGTMAELLAGLSAGGPGVAAAIRQADAVFGTAGVSLTETLGSLGGEGVIAVTLRPGMKTQAEVPQGFAVLWEQEVADAKPAERLIKLAREKLAAAPKEVKVRPEPGGFSAEIKGGPVPHVKVRLARGQLFVGVGQRDLVDHAILALDKGKGTLGDDPAHARVIAAMPPDAQARLWVDFGLVADLAAASAPPAQRGPLEIWANVSKGPARATSALALSGIPEGDRMRVELDEVNGIGVFAALAIYGVRSYVSSSKTAEAKNTVQAIGRAAVAAYEREQLGPNNTVVHALCASALPVPSAVLHAKKYMPSSRSGNDWNSGSATAGWQCLRFAIDVPHYYQYTYSAGGPYKGPARGGPDPGPNGFEVAAEGDLDGDGTTSLFTITGTVDPQTGSVKLSPMFVDREKD